MIWISQIKIQQLGSNCEEEKQGTARLYADEIYFQVGMSDRGLRTVLLLVIL